MTASIILVVAIIIGFAVWLTMGRLIHGEWNAFERVLAREKSDILGGLLVFLIVAVIFIGGIWLGIGN